MVERTGWLSSILSKNSARHVIIPVTPLAAPPL
jgi:hypothetical protein